MEGKPSIAGPGPMHSDPPGNGAVSGEPLQLLVQGMRQLQQAYMFKSEVRDSDLKGNVHVPEMPKVGAEAAVAFADWLYELEQSIGGMSDRASVWFTSCLSVARQTYTAYTLASPLERLTMKPQVPEALKDEKWSRLDKRVMALLLSSMKKTAKDDAVTHRVEDVTSLLYRLHVLYQPGGASERAAILKQLEGRALGENVYDCVMALRKWRRYIERAEAMQVSIPDASLLLGGLELMIRKVLEAHPEVKFRVALMKNELQLQGRPTVSGVLRLHTHVLAELQTIAPLNQGTTPTALKAVGASSSAGTDEPASPPSSPTRKSTGKLPCKFFLSKTGCTRGPTCKFEHTFESKEENAVDVGNVEVRVTDAQIAQWPQGLARVVPNLKAQGRNPLRPQESHHPQHLNEIQLLLCSSRWFLRRRQRRALKCQQVRRLRNLQRRLRRPMSRNYFEKQTPCLANSLSCRLLR